VFVSAGERENPVLGSTKVTDEKLQRVLDSVPPVTLPHTAYGPVELTWLPPGEYVAVWAWVQWPDRAATRVPAFVHGYNDRVCLIKFETDTGTRQVSVWRNAVRKRK
jgi:hypothetical protein